MLVKIYRLLHEYSEKKTIDGEPLINTIELGYFSSRKKVREVINKYKNLEGFKDFDTKCFKIKRFYIFVKNRPTSIYELYHSYIDASGYEEYKFFGVYLSEAKARKKQSKLIKHNAIYRNNQDGFEVTEEVVDIDNTIWNQGFTSVSN